MSKVKDRLAHFKSKINKTESGCWEWTGTKHKIGYGMFWNGRKNVLSHRYAYEVFKKDSLKNFYVCHSCDNRLCVNPDHLWLGTAKDNTKDCIEKGRFKDGGFRIESTKITDENVLDIRKKHKELVDNLSNIYKISQSQINNIIRKKQWKKI